MISLTLEEVLNAPDLPPNLPQFEIISECKKVDFDDGSRVSEDNDDASSSEDSDSSSE